MSSKLSQDDRHTFTEITLYRKKPVTVAAAMLAADQSNLDDLVRWIKVGGGKCYACYASADSVLGIMVVTLEGSMLVMPGDWIIKGVKGEFYPCKPDIFEATYEREP